MKISIFPECKPHPTKAEKRTEAFKFSAPYLPKVTEVATEDQLIDTVTKYAWSPAIFSGVRKAENFVSCDFLVYDIDEKLTIDGADAILQKLNYCYLILPSPSHTPELHRFRVILPLSHSILDLETFESTWIEGAKLFGVVDEHCSDSCRAYFGSTQEDGFADFSKDFFTPVKKEPVPEKGYRPSQTLLLDVTAETKEIITQIYGEERDKVSEAVDYFVRNAHTGIPGGWTSALNSFTFSLSYTGIDGDEIVAIVEQLAPEPLTERDCYQVKKAIEDGRKKAVRDGKIS